MCVRGQNLAAHTIGYISEHPMSAFDTQRTFRGLKQADLPFGTHRPVSSHASA